MSIFDNMATALGKEPGNEGMIQIIQGLKTDPEVLVQIQKYQAGLEGTGDITEVGQAPGLESSASSLTIDFTGNSAEDLELYSDYIAGSGTTLGGFFSALPETLGQLAESGANANVVKVVRKNISNLSQLNTQFFNHQRAFNTNVSALDTELCRSHK